MSESVDILIKAEDMATPVVAKSAKSVDSLDASIKRLKESGEKAKKSTEFFGSIANVLGGTQIGSFAGQIANVTEKTSQFAEVQKLGGAGALAFKAGLVAAVGAIAFQFGQAIGNAIFQTDKWNRKLEEANEKAKQLAGSLASATAQQFSDKKEDIALIVDPEAKKAQYQALLGDLTKNLQGVEATVKTGRKDVEAWNNAWFKTGNRAAFAEQAKNKLAEDEQRLKVMQDQAQEVRRLLSERTKENAELARSGPLLKSMKDELSLIVAEQQDWNKETVFVGQDATLQSLKDQLAILESKNGLAQIAERAKQAEVGAAQSETQQLITQIEIAKKKAEIAKEEVALRTKSLGFIDSLKKELTSAEAAKRDASQQRTIFTGNDAGIQSLKEEISLLQERKNIQALSEKAALNTVGGKDKAEAEALMLKIALTQKQTELGKAEEEQARRIAEIKAQELQKIEEQTILLTQGKKAAAAFSLVKQGLSQQDANDIVSKQIGGNPQATELKAVESRLMTRGSTSDEMAKQVAQNTMIAAKELQALNAKFAEDRKNQTTVRVIK